MCDLDMPLFRIVVAIVVATDRVCVCGWLAFVSAMIVCYLKPKLRARVVLLLVTILVNAKSEMV